MATSGLISGTMTAREVCDTAAQELGVYSAGEALSAADAAAMLIRLNWMLKSWQANGCNLWREEEGTVTFAADQRTETLDPRCMDVMQAQFVRSDTFEQMIQRWETGEYQSLPNKAQSGMPTIFYLRKMVDSVTMTLWPVPFEETVIRYTYARIIEDVTDLEETLDIPQEWMETVWMNLAVRCAPMFGATRLDPAGFAVVQQRAAILEEQLMGNDRPASVFFANTYSNFF